MSFKSALKTFLFRKFVFDYIYELFQFILYTSFYFCYQKYYWYRFLLQDFYYHNHFNHFLLITCKCIETSKCAHKNFTVIITIIIIIIIIIIRIYIYIYIIISVSYTHLRAHETDSYLVTIRALCLSLIHIWRCRRRG